MNPNKVLLLLQKGVSYHQTGQFQKAEKIYKSILKKQPDNVDAIHLLGVIKCQSGQFKESIKLINRAIKINPDNPEYYTNCGEAYRRLQQIDEAINCYDNALKMEPNYPEAHNNLGIALKIKGSYEDAISHLKQAVSLQPNYTDAHYNLGNVYQLLNRHEDAIRHYNRVLTINPCIAEVHNNLGSTFHKKGLYQEAIEYFEQAIKIKPDYAIAENNLGMALTAQKNFTEAYQHYAKALILEPHYAEVHHNLGDLLQSQDKLEEAIKHYKKALILIPTNADTHHNIGTALADQGWLEPAISHYKKALELRPDYPEAYNNLGNAYQSTGQMGDAIEYFQKALKLKPDYAIVYRNLAIFGKGIFNEKNIDEIYGLLDKPDISEPDAVNLHFALGEIFDNKQSYEKAYKHYSQGNKLKRKTIDYSPEEHVDYINRLIDTFSKSFVAEKIKHGNSSDLPVFVIGMPRSGTSLVEQIISNHSQIYGAGELNDFLHIEQDLSVTLKTELVYPECITLIDEHVSNEISNKYLSYLHGISHDAIRITDKLPSNFLRVGLIKIIFPNAKIIHCYRNPLDTCLSIYLNYFIGVHHYAYDLTELGEYYQQYKRLMSHWFDIFPSEILDVGYEELVMNQEIISKQMIEYLGVEWDERCLEFYKNKRPVQSASNLQVREPMYTRSIDRWMHYEKFIGPLVETLNNVD